MQGGKNSVTVFGEKCQPDYSGGHFVINTNTESWCLYTETNIMNAACQLCLNRMLLI